MKRSLTGADRHPQPGDILRYFNYPMRVVRYGGIGVPTLLYCEQVKADDFTQGIGRGWEIPTNQWKRATYEQRADGGPIEIEREYEE